MDIKAALDATPGPGLAARLARPTHPTGREYEWDGTKGWLSTEPLADRPKTWDAFIVDAGLDPDEVEVQEPVQVRGWDSPVGAGNVVRMHYYRLTLRRRGLRVDLDELVKAARRRATASKEAAEGQAFILALGDLQLGKMDGDGVEGTVARFVASTAAAVARYKRIAKGAPVYLLHLGDCIEGMVSQGGANAWRTPLTTTEQVRLYRRLVIEQVKAFASIAPQVVLAGVPGNHDEANRPLQTYGDSWAVDSLAAVHDALQLAGNYEHVSVMAPDRDELTLTLDVCGTVIGMAHGHQFGRGIDGWRKWWQGQQHGRQPIGDADVLLAGHYHHLRVEQGSRTFIQTPALESGSQWWKHRAGEWGNPGVITMLAGGGQWSALEVLR
jgi:predicted phosphodiesterase